MSHQPSTTAPIVYWHRDLPPLSARVLDEHVVEATSGRVQGTIAHRNELWDRCYQDLMAEARHRLEQEVDRLNGQFAHVLAEVIEAQRDDAKGETWLHGRFTWVLYGGAASAPANL